MARLKRIGPLGIPQHIIQRGNNRQVGFASEQDMAVYASLLDEYSRKYLVAIHAWVFMTNHVHLLATPHAQRGVSNMMQALGKVISLSTPHEEYLCLGNTYQDRQRAYRTLFRSHVDSELQGDIRSAVNKGLALGGEREPVNNSV